jgi:predicted metal-dependent hydrolase
MRIADAQLSLWPRWGGTPAHQPVAAVRHSRRARRVAVRIDALGRVELVVPRGVPESRALAFLDSRAGWIKAQLQRRQEQALPEQPFPPAVVQLSALDERWPVFDAGGAGRLRLREHAQGLLEFTGSGTKSQRQRLLLRWLVRHAEVVCTELVAQVAAQHGFKWCSLRMRRQRTRWGSCSAQGAISLNVALLFQRPELLRYLICHELAHTEHMNHSARFWRRVAQCEPRYRALDAQLRDAWNRVPQWILEPA